MSLGQWHRQKEKFIATYHQQGTFIFQVLDVASYFLFKTLVKLYKKRRGHHSRDRMVVGFKTAYAISAYHQLTSCTGEVCLIQH
jgi:hypothetical protein